MAGLKAYLDSDLTTRAKTQVGRLDGDGTTKTFSVSEEPDEVRLYNNDKPYGEVLTGWTYDSGTGEVTLESAPANGDTVIAFVGTIIFSSQRSKVTSATESDRTLEQQIWLYADGIDAENISVNIADLLSTVGADTSWYQIAPDSGGSPGTYQDFPYTIDSISNGNSVSVWIKAIEPQDANKTDPETFRDVYLDISYDAVSVQ